SVAITYLAYLLLPGDKDSLSFDVHAEHIRLAKLAQQQATNPQFANLNLPSLKGDRTRRFTVSFSAPDTINPNEDTTLSFKVNDASSGNETKLFQKVYSKFAHLVIVDSSLSYFSHIHPDVDGNNFTITTQFPKDGIYHLYINFQPFGAIEQQFAFTVNVGNV